MAPMDTVNNNNGSRTVTTLIIQSGLRTQCRGILIYILWMKK